MSLPPLVLDNTLLSNFALIGHPDLLTALVGVTVGTTPEVLHEYQQGVEQSSLPPHTWQNLAIFTLLPSEKTFMNRLPSRLGIGECSCLAVAVHRAGILATDDADARREAKGYGVGLTGTVGVLLLLVRQNKLAVSEADALLTAMIACGYRAPVVSLADLLPK
jgi:predicted nucleic acid-binding protein